MGNVDRRDEILRVLRERGAISVADLAARLNVSLETVRRDLKPLSRDGKVLRMHGGVGLAPQHGEAPLERRMRENAEAKRMIASRVAAAIRDGDSLVLDAGSTTSYVARALRDRAKLTVITNSPDVARTLAGVGGNRVFLAGGELHAEAGAVLGGAAVEFTSRFAVVHAVISAGAVHCDGGVMSYEFEEAEFARAAIASARRAVVAADASKFGRKGLVRVCGLAELDVVVTDCRPPDDLGAALRTAGVRVEIAERADAPPVD